MDPGTWARLMAGRRADLVVTSPPYNVGLRYASYKDAKARERYFDLIRAVGRLCVAHLAPGRFVAWNVGVSPDSFPHWHPVLLEECGLTFMRQIVWVKQGVPWPVFPATLRKRRARHYTPNYRHEMVYLLQADGDGRSAPEVDCPVCDGESARVRRREPARAAGPDGKRQARVGRADCAVEALPE